MNVVLKDGEQRCDLDVEIQNDAKFVPPSKVILKNVDNTSNAAENKSLINPRLIKIYLLSFVCATIYVGFPVVNSSGETSYWAYYLAKCQYWNFFGNAGFVEIIEAALPGAPLHIYVYAYIFGWGIPALFHVILYYAQVPQYLAINILLQASSLIVTVVLYGYWQLTSDYAEDNMLRYRLSATDDQVLHDMFNAVLDIDDAEALACDSSMGMTGIGGRTESQTFPTVNLNGDVNAAARQDSTSDERFISHSRAMWIRTKKRFKQEEQDALTEARRQRASIVDKSFSGSHNTTSIQKGSLIPFLTESRNPITANNGDFDRASCDTADRSSHLTQQSSCSTLYRAASGTSMDAFCDEGEYDEDYFSTMEDAQYAPNSLPMLCKYYEILPRFWYRKLGEGPGAHITSRYRKWHFMWATLFLIGWIAIFFMLMVFTSAFRSSSENQRYGWFALFLISSTGSRMAMKRLGLQLDRGKIGTCSMFFVAEFMCTLFYFTFYRLLFEQFIGWGLFFGIQLTHFVLEWCMCCWRGTRTFYNFAKSLPNCMSIVRNMFVMPGLSFRDWQMFLSLDFSIRVSILIFSGPTFLLLLLLTSEAPWVHSFLKPISYKQYFEVVSEIGMCLIFETLNNYAMFRLFFRANKLKVRKYLYHVFQDFRYCIICFCLAVCLLINPFAAYEDYTSNFEYRW